MPLEPTGYQMCSRTVMDTTDPDIWFDSNGVSSHALRYDREMRAIVEAAEAGEREGELQQVVEAIKRDGKGKPYDCIVGISGGVDSTYLVWRAVNLGLRPLAVHFDGGWNSEEAVANMKNIVDKLGLDLVIDRPDPAEMSDLQLAFLRSGVPNCDIPTDHAFPAVAYAQAKKHKIKYILSGSNLATESILPQSWGYDSADARHLKAIHKRFGSVPLRTYPITGMLRRYVWNPIFLGVKTVKLLDYGPYNLDEAKRTIEQELGWQDYGGKHYESIFTRYFQGYYLPTRFGFDKRRAHLSSLVVSNQKSREQALAELESTDYPESQREADAAIIAGTLGITVEELDRLAHQPPVDHMAYPNNKKPFEVVFGLMRGVTKTLKSVPGIRQLLARAGYQ